MVQAAPFPGTPDLFVRKMNGSAANPHAANPPAIAVPETLSLPDAVIISDIGRTAVIAVTGSIAIVAGPIIARAGKRATDDGAADQSAGYSSAKTPLRMGGRGRRHGRNSQGGDSSECHQCFPHGFTFLIKQGQRIKRSVAAKVPYFV